MLAACLEPLPLYRPRNPQTSDLWRLLDLHFETFQQVYDERFAAQYGFWRPIVERRVQAFLKCGDRAGIERLVGNITRCPFSHSRLVKVTTTGQVIDKAEKDACRAFPDPQDAELAQGTQRNFQILDPLEFLAEFTRPGVPGAPIPPQGAHLIRYYGWYSNKARGMRSKAAAAADSPAGSSSAEAAAAPPRSRASQTWAMLVQRVYEIDPLVGPRCSGAMKVLAFLEPPQGDVIEKILKHCGLWCPSSPRAPPTGDLRGHDPDGDGDVDSTSQEPRELTCVDEATFWSTF